MSHIHTTLTCESVNWSDVERCSECGTSLLELIYRANRWVNRRVESISFVDERTVRRRVSVDLQIPSTAPIVRTGDNEGDERAHPFGGVSFDRVGGGFRSVDLHVVDVPYGSLCRAQVRLGVPVGGWLTSIFSIMVASSLLVTGVTWWANSYQGRQADNTTHEAVATMVATFAIGLIALFSQPIRHKMAAKLLLGRAGICHRSGAYSLVSRHGGRPECSSSAICPLGVVGTELGLNGGYRSEFGCVVRSLSGGSDPVSLGASAGGSG